MRFLSLASNTFLFLAFSVSLFFTSCIPARKAIFFNGLVPGKDSVDKVAEEMAKRIYPGDRITISIITENKDGDFLNAGQNATGGNINANLQTGTGGGGYLVDKDGNVQLVKLGVLHVAGLNPTQVAEEVRTRAATLYKDPTVYCTLSGRVLFLGSGTAGSGGGVVAITNDRLTILEALSLKGQGDATASRDRVWIIREKGEIREYATVNINDKDIFQSPYYYLRNNDIIYMEPNKTSTFLTVNSPLRNLITTGFSALAFVISLLAILR